MEKKYRVRGVNLFGEKPFEVMKFIVIDGYDEFTMYLGNFKFHKTIEDYYYLSLAREERRIKGGGTIGIRNLPESGLSLILWGESVNYGKVPDEILLEFHDELRKSTHLREQLGLPEGELNVMFDFDED